MASDDIQNLLKSGIEAARSGNKTVARGIFEQVIKLDSQNELAWMWLASVLETPAERQRALQRVLSLNPQNERAKQALEKLQGAAAPAKRDSEVPRKPPTGPLRPKTAPLAQPPAPSAPPEARLRTDFAPPAGRRRGMSSTLFFGGVAIAVALIGAAIVLLVLQLGSEEETSSPAIVQPPVVAATLVPPTATPRPAITIPPGAFTGGNELPPTWTPSPTATSLPTETPPPPPMNLEDMQILFAGAENPVALVKLEVIQGNGANRRPLGIELQADDIEIAVVPTATPQPQDLPPDAVTAPTAEPSADSTAEAEPTAIAPPTVYENLEFLDPAYSPDGRFVVFTAQIAPDIQELFLLTVDNGRVRQLTTLGGSVTDGAVWSPDGTQLAFSSNARGLFDIYVLNPDIGEMINLTAVNGQNREPNWSPDGQTLVFSSDRATPGELEIWSMPSGGGVAVQLTDDVNASFSPDFSSDGTRIVFVSNRGGDNDIYVMNADGTSEQLLTINDKGADDRDPAWSPDDNWIVFSSNREEELALQLWLMRPNGADLRKLTEGDGNSRFPDWHPQETQ